MVPVLTEVGKSFKGAAAYYLHDKREEGEVDRFTADRVAWTETVNLATSDPDRAWRMMADTAMSQGELKKAAGVKATGQKLQGPVFAYSLAWHEDDRPTREQQLEAARETLKVLGLEDRQALIIAHNDTAHAHVHVLVNRVSPENGVAAKLDRSKRKIQAWALDYQKRHGQDHCPRRQENADKRQQGQEVHEGRVSRPMYEFRKAVANDSLKADFVLAEQRQKDAQLHSLGRALAESHSRQWKDIKRTFQAGKDKLFAYERRRIDQKKAEIKEAFKPAWAALFQRHRAEQRAFEQTERGGLSVIFNMAYVWRELRKQDEKIGLFAMAYAMLSAGERRNVLDIAHQTEQKALARQQGQAVGRAVESIRVDTEADLSRLRREFVDQAGQLSARHANERAEQQIRWRDRSAERKAALAAVQGQHQAQGQRPGRRQELRQSLRDDPLPSRGPRPN